MYTYLFGPVPSRRLGMSLGIDIIPKKVCSLNCVYCEVGETTKLTTERKAYIHYSKIEAELHQFFKSNTDPDFFTFSGYGEPTLNTNIGQLIHFLKEKKPEIPIAVLTNGTLLYDKALQKEILDADIVLPSLDAVSENIFRKINRPADNLTTDKHIRSLIDFREIYKGEIWLEIFILPGYNDAVKEIAKFKYALDLIRPDKIQLNTLDRPGLLKDLKPATIDQLNTIAEQLGDKAEIIASAAYRKENKAFNEDIESIIIQTISRRPCTLQDLEEITGVHLNEINKYLDVLENEHKIKSKHHERGVFYQISDS